jgi:hypothetical protein
MANYNKHAYFISALLFPVCKECHRCLIMDKSYLSIIIKLLEAVAFVELSLISKQGKKRRVTVKRIHLNIII